MAEPAPYLWHRREPLIMGWQAKVRHLPRYGNIRYGDTFQLLCGRGRGWFWRPGLMNEELAKVRAGKAKPPKLPLCAECARRYETMWDRYRKEFKWILKYKRS